MRPPSKFLLLSFICLIAPGLLCQAPSSSGCTVRRGYYQCDRNEFLAALKDAKTVAVESKPSDTAITNSLGKLVRSLNKDEANSGDLTFVLIRAQAEGIFYGPSERELASLLVYSNIPKGSDRKLIWIETFNGEPDLVWPIVVFNIIKQFKAGI